MIFVELTIQQDKALFFCDSELVWFEFGWNMDGYTWVGIPDYFYARFLWDIMSYAIISGNSTFNNPSYHETESHTPPSLVAPKRIISK